ncbi:MAG: HyaD/HybD family hydrogenase maturation endopeptidase [Anaerolineae bacterium]
MLGLGNLLLSDEGLGVHAVRRLQPLLQGIAGVSLVDGGTLGLELLSVIEETTHLIAVDALLSGRPPGSVTILRDQEALRWETASFSAHDFGLPSVLGVARLRGWEPREVAVVGVEPATMQVGVSLSPAVGAAVESVVASVVDLLRQWGFVPEDG